MMQTKESSKDKSIFITNCTTIDASGRLGSLYDGHQDRLVGQLHVDNQERLTLSDETLRCEIIKSSNNQASSLSQLLDIDEQLRLIGLLKLAPNQNLASLIDYPYPKGQYIRLFYYSAIHRTHQLPDTIEDVQKFIKPLAPQTVATHVITAVQWGVEIAVILQLPSTAGAVTMIDCVLQRICNFLLSHYDTLPLTSDEKGILKRIIHTKVYSNIPDLKKQTTLYDVCRYVQQNKNTIVDHPISYTIRPIKWLYSRNMEECVTFINLPGELSDKIEQYIFQLAADINILETSVNEDLSKFLSEHLNEQLSNVQKQLIEAKNKYNNVIELFSKLVIDYRSGQIQKSLIDEELNKTDRIILKKSIRDLIQNIDHLKEKGHLINDLNRQKFQYYNVVDYSIDRTCTESTIERKLLIREEYDRVLCSNDTLNRNKRELLNKLRCELFKERMGNLNLRLYYADFSYCSFVLSDITILPARKKNFVNINNYNPSLSLTQGHTIVPPSTNEHTLDTRPSLVPEDDILNILLLGETGVGKSTFINAFANYLTFSTLDNAQIGKPVVLIPVSFLITVGDNFDERTVKFGDLSSTNNENFSRPGQSVTQKCKPYVFDLDQYDRRKIRIIDTPGFGDTRGVDQDDRNMEHILEYIKNLSHLNAVCFLLKPNESRLNIFFRSCVTQLFSLLRPNARNNIIFCFTNARSTFYTPGNTAPLLKDMLATLPIGNIPFQKKNTFCFDSESFRYLVALQENIRFSILERQEYEKSWLISATESNRLIEYICRNISAYRIEDEVQ